MLSTLIFIFFALILSSPQTGLPGAVAGQGAVTTEAADQGEPQAGRPAAPAAGRAEQGLQGAAAGRPGRLLHGRGGQGAAGQEPEHPGQAGGTAGQR